MWTSTTATLLVFQFLPRPSPASTQLPEWPSEHKLEYIPPSAKTLSWLHPSCVLMSTHHHKIWPLLIFSTSRHSFHPSLTQFWPHRPSFHYMIVPNSYLLQGLSSYCFLAWNSLSSRSSSHPGSFHSSDVS